VVEAGSFPTSPAERRLIEAVEDAETSRELSRLMPQVLASQNPDVRQAMVDALEDQGARSVNDLAYFMADPDLEVADSAFSAWTSVLEDTSPARRIAAIRAAARILTPPPAPAVQP
jgi:HEAT repeat protein